MPIVLAVLSVLSVALPFTLTEPVSGKLVRGEIPPDYRLANQDDPDAMAATAAGGFMLREKVAKQRAPYVMGVNPMVDLPIDPALPENCAKASAMMAEGMKAKLEHADVVRLSFGKACRAELSVAGSKLVSRTYSWQLVPAKKLAVMVACSSPADDAYSAKLCQSFAESVRPVAQP